MLGVNREADAKEILKAYRKRSLEWHPDKATAIYGKDIAEKLFKRLGNAYEVLKDESKRRAYE